MPNRIIMRKIELADSYQPISEQRLIATVTVAAAATNMAEVFFLGDTGDDVPWVAGQWHTFKSVDISDLKIKGTDGDSVIVIGGSW